MSAIQAPAFLYKTVLGLLQMDKSLANPLDDFNSYIEILKIKQNQKQETHGTDCV